MAFCCTFYCSHLWCDFKIDTLKRLIVGYSLITIFAVVMLPMFVYITMYLALENYGGKVFLVLDSVSTTVVRKSTFLCSELRKRWRSELHIFPGT